MYWIPSLHLSVLLCFSLFSLFVCQYNENIQYDPDGKLQQLELSRKLVRLRGGPICAMIGQDESILVLSVRPTRRSPLHLSEQEKVLIMENDLLLAITGSYVTKDIISTATKDIMSRYQRQFGNSIPIETLVERLANVLHEQTCTEGSAVMPCNLLLAGRDSKGRHAIFTIDCDGSFQSWRAVALGKESAISMQVLANVLDSKQTDDMSTGSQVCSQYESLFHGLKEKGILEENSLNLLLETNNPSDNVLRDYTNPWDVEVFVLPQMTSTAKSNSAIKNIPINKLPTRWMTWKSFRKSYQ